jgi:septum formation protein
MKYPPIILASNSPRRQELLRQIGVMFEATPSNVPENFDSTWSPHEIVRILAERKVIPIAWIRPEALIIGADTVVYLEGEVFGKPNSPKNAIQMLKRLSGRTHQVITGVAFHWVDKGFYEVIDVTTEVTFGVLPDNMIVHYVKTGEAFDKAGAYGIQGLGALFVESIKGSYSNVVGLPLFEVGRILRRLNTLG